MKIGLALGGGGAKGFAHIGVLKVLEEAGLRVDMVAGTSVGALVGAVYAAGNLARLEAEARAITLTDVPLLLSPAWSLSGLFSGKNALEMLSELLGCERFEDLPIPFAAVSCDLNSSSRVTFTAGLLREAIRASISIPAVFTPVPRDSTLLVDGALLEPLPVQTTRDLGADLVIAVNLFGSTPPSIREEKRRSGILSGLQYLSSLSAKLPWGSKEQKGFPTPTVIDIIERTLAVSQRELTKFRLAEHPADLLIEPEIADIGTLDFHTGEAGIEIGIRAARAALPELEKLLGRASR